MFWSSSTPTVQDIGNHIDEIRVRATKLDKTLQLGQSMSYFDAIWIARAAYRLGVYLGTASKETQQVPDPIDPTEANKVLAKVQNLYPIVVDACDKCGKAKSDFDRLLVLSVVKIQLRWLASKETEFAHVLVSRCPNPEIKAEGQRLADQLDGSFAEMLSTYGLSLQGAPPAAQEV